MAVVQEAREPMGNGGYACAMQAAHIASIWQDYRNAEPVLLYEPAFPGPVE